MKALYQFLETYIKTNLTDYKTVEPYNKQDFAIEKLQNMSILYPAVFIEFIVNDVQALSMGLKNMDLTIRFRFMFENYTFKRLDDMEDVDIFATAMERVRGNEADTVQFTSLEEIGRNLDEDHDMINLPYVDFRTLYRNTGSYKRNNVFVPAPIEVEISGTIEDEV